MSGLSRFALCARRGMKGALQLASRCANVSTDALEEAYRNLMATNDGILSVSKLDEDEDEELAQELDQKLKNQDKAASPGTTGADAPPANACSDFVEQMFSSLEVGDSEKIATDSDATSDLNNLAASQDYEDADDLSGLPERALIADLCGKVETEPFGCEAKQDGKGTGSSDSGNHLPKTLLEAMQLPGCTWNALFRLVLRLRSAKGGSDLQFLKNPRSCRKAAKGLNWHQLL